MDGIECLLLMVHARSDGRTSLSALLEYLRVRVMQVVQREREGALTCASQSLKRLLSLNSGRLQQAFIKGWRCCQKPQHGPPQQGPSSHGHKQCEQSEASTHPHLKWAVRNEVLIAHLVYTLLRRPAIKP